MVIGKELGCIHVAAGKPGHPIPQLRKLALSLGQHLIFRWKARIRGSLDVTVANTMSTRRGWLRPSAKVRPRVLSPAHHEWSRGLRWENEPHHVGGLAAVSRRRPPVVTPAALPAFTSPSMRRRISDRHSSFCPQISPDSATKAQEGISEWLGKKRPRYISATRVNAEAKMRRLAGAKIHRRCWQENPELGAFSSGIRLGSDYPPRRQHWRGVNGAYFD